jgi:hypothetical protein
MLHNFGTLGWVALAGIGWMAFFSLVILVAAGIRRLWKCR